MKRSLLIVGMIVALGAAFWLGTMTGKEKKSSVRGDMAGIGQARRMHEGTVSQKQIIRDHPEYTELLQSATFQNVMKDKDFRAMSATPEFWDLAKNQKLVCLLLSQDIVKNKALYSLATDPLLLKVIIRKDLAGIMEPGLFKIIVSNEFREYIANPAVQKFLSNPGNDPNKLPRSDRLKAFGMYTPALVQLLSVPEARQLFTTSEHFKVFGKIDLIQVELNEIVRLYAFCCGARESLYPIIEACPVMMGVLEREDVRVLIRQPKFIELAANLPVLESVLIAYSII